MYINKLKNISISFYFLSILFSQSSMLSLQATSISESDGMDTFLNPAGLAKDNGWENFCFGVFDSNRDISEGMLYVGNKIKGIGYYAGYNQNDKFKNPSEYNISFGQKLSNNISTGVMYDHNETITLGSIWRPYNFLSTGLTLNSNDDFKIGFSLRPFNNHKFSFGYEMLTKYDDFNNDNSTSQAYLKFMDIKGIDLTLKHFIESEQINLNLNLNLNKMKFNTSKNLDNNLTTIGFFKSSKKRNSVIKKNDKKFVKMILNNQIIEEPPKLSKFDFDFNRSISIPFFSNNNTKKAVQLRKWIDTVDSLSEDESIEGMIIYFKDVQASFNKRSEMRQALQRFKKSNKKIYLYSEQGISNINYHLASVADSIFINPLTGVDLRGLSLEVTFFRGLLDSLKIVPEVYRVSKDGKSYKGAGDPFINTSMSAELKENYNNLLDDIYSQFVNDIAESKKWSLNKTEEIINNGPYWSTQEAIDNELVNYSMYPDEFKNYIQKISKNRELIDFWEINNESNYTYEWKNKDKPKIAIIYAVGGIVSGKSNPGPFGSTIMGDKTIIKALQQVRKDESIDAIILRIDSGGGSALASDQIWKEISNITDDKDNKIPFIASMSNSAASGGYYIACNADTIVAHPSTVTGSIGVISVLFNISDLYKKIGINKEVIKKGDFSDLNTQSRQWNDKERQKYIDSIENFYVEFKSKVIDGRSQFDDIDKLDEIALGRVWTGNQALENGLIDKIGGTVETIEIAKKMAGIDLKQEIEIIEYPKQNQFKIEKTLQYDLQILNLLPKDIQNELSKYNITPILANEKIYFLMPHNIEIK